MITYTNNLDIYPGNPPIVIKLSQYDTDFSLVFNLFSSRGTLTIASGTTAVFREKKPDGNVMSVDATIDVTNKTVTLTPSDTIAKQITAIAGKCCCELSLQKNNDELNTANFVLLVEKAPVDIDEIPSDSVLRELYDVTDRADEIMEAAELVTTANIFQVAQDRPVRELLLAKDNIGIDDTSNVEVFEKLITPTETMPLYLYNYSNNQATPISAVYGCYKKYSVTPGETYYITGRHYYTDLPLYILLNSSNTVVGHYDGGTVGHNVDKYKLVMPNNATTLIVNGAYIAYEKISVTQKPDILQQTVYDGLIALRSGSTTQYEILSSEATYAKCVRFNISQNTGYCLIGGRHYYTDRPLYIITNSNGTVLKYHNGGTSGYDSDICCFAAPANSAYLYVNVSKNFVKTVKLYRQDTYYTLNGFVNTKIDKIVTLFTGKIVTPQMYGANPNAAGTNDCSSAIQKAIEAAKGGTVYFPKGNYGISSPIQTYKNNTNYTNLVFADGAKVIALNSMPYMLNLGVLGNDTRVGHVRKILRGGIFDASNGNVTTAVVHISSGCMTLDMSNFQINANGCDGLHVGDSGSSSSIDANIHHGFINKTDTQNSTNSGIKIFGTDNNISNVRVYYFKYNVDILADAQFLSDIHTLATSGSQGDISLYVHDNVHIHCSNFYGDSEDTFVYLGVGSTIIANNLYYYSYRSNSVTVFDVHNNSRVFVCGFHLNVKNYNYKGFKLSSGALSKAISKGNFIITGMEIEGGQYLRNGDPLKCVMSSDGQPLFNETTLQANTWYYVCSYPADANTVHWFEIHNGIKRTEIPLNVKYSNGLVDSLLLSQVETNDSGIFDVGFSLLDTANGYALINIYVRPTASMAVDSFTVCSKYAVGGSTVNQQADTSLSSASVTPSIIYRVNCADKTIVKLT